MFGIIPNLNESEHRNLLADKIQYVYEYDNVEVPMDTNVQTSCEELNMKGPSPYIV